MFLGTETFFSKSPPKERRGFFEREVGVAVGLTLSVVGRVAGFDFGAELPEEAAEFAGD